MASISSDKNGRKRVQFSHADKRQTLRLGKISLEQARLVSMHIKNLQTSQRVGTAIPLETSEWVSKIGDELHGKLAMAGIIPARKKTVLPSVAEFVREYIESRKDVKHTTRLIYEQSEMVLEAIKGLPLNKVTVTDADAVKSKMVSEKYARATIASRMRCVRHFFEVAKRRKVIAENPFAHIKGAIKGDPARRVIIPESSIRRVLDYVIDPEWRLLIGLAYYGGLRVPSEPLAMKWDDVNFGGEKEPPRFVVRASKTEHWMSGGIRIVPMFPELVPLFQAVFDQAEEGEVFVIERYRTVGVNLRTQFIRYILKAGLKPWPKLWQNLRASRATMLADIYPSHVCAAWLGHTETVANEYYRQVTEGHFEKAAQKTAQQPAAGGSNERQLVPLENDLNNPLCLSGDSDGELVLEGTEPTSGMVKDKNFVPQSGAKSDATVTDITDSQVSRVVSTWGGGL